MVLFGVGSGPLVWGRVAAWAMRSTQALFQDDVRVHCFVDDPLVAIMGTPQVRKEIAATIMLWWTALGARLAYQKGQLGETVEWIGAQVAVNAMSKKVEVRLPLHRHLEVQGMLESILTEGRGMLSRPALRSLVGKESWVAGLLPQLRPFVRQL